MKAIYLDYNASTPIAPEVLAAMRPFQTENFGNPSRSHWAGVPVKEAIENARGQVGALLVCSSREVVFTSGGTEANNHAIKGAFFALHKKGNHIITSRVEHPATLQPCRFLERLGAEVTYLPVDETGLVNPQDVQRAITSRTILVSVMHANNEIGTIEPIAEIARITRESNVLLHTDAAQSAGKIPINVASLGVDLLSVAGHKLYAPKGVGALYIRQGVELEPFMHGAGHERGRRAGTESALLIVALGRACELAGVNIEPNRARLIELRDYLHTGLTDLFGETLHLNGHPTQRLPNTLNVSLAGRVGSEILQVIPDVAASTGSACHSGRVRVSPVLEAIGVPDSIAVGAIRFSVGRGTTIEQLEHVLGLLRSNIK